MKSKNVKPIRETTASGAKQAVALMKECLDKATAGGFLVEFWRLGTGIRSNDAAYGTVAVSGKTTGKTGKTGKSGKADSGKADSGKVDSGKVDSGKIASGKVDVVTAGKCSAGKCTGKTGKATGKTMVVEQPEAPAKGIVNKVRYALLTPEQAAILRVTGYQNWPAQRTWTIVSEVAPTGNKHADEHFGLEQGSAGVLNKAFE